MNTTARARLALSSAILTLGLSSIVAACGGTVDPAPGSTQAPETLVTEGAPASGSRASIQRIAKVQTAGERQPELVTATTPHLNYYGGPVISNAKVVQVLWGGGVDPEVVANLGPFYGAIMQSPYVDWLSEYDTTVSGGTNQTIGRGTFGGAYTITPSTSATTIDDTVIQSELLAQIAAGHLPANDANTVYMIDFAPGYVITLSGSASCSQFCAYHGTTLDSSNNQVYYGVLPDLGSGGCQLGCGSAATLFDNTTSVASHELGEAITDPAVGLSQAYAPPLAWYDPQGSDGEIGDICNAQQGSIVGGNGVTYTVQKLWSNQENACIVSRTVTSDFTLADNPTTLSLAQGASGQSTVSTGVVGPSETVTLSVSGLPAGATASFSPASVTSGSSSTLTITAGASTPAGTYSLTIQGTATSGSHTTTLSLTVTSSVVDDFSLGLGATALSVHRCRSTSDAVHTAVTSGSAETIALSATGLPAGAAVAFQPTSVSSGGSSTATFQAGCRTPRGTYSVNVVGTAATGSHAAALRLTVR